MHHARRPLSLALLAIATLTGMPACKPSTPAPTQQGADATVETPASAPAPASAAPTAAPTAGAPVPPPAAPATNDPVAHEAVVAAMRKLMALRSYRVTIRDSEGGKEALPGKLDYVAPDRYRLETPGMAAQVLIGDTLYLTEDGRTKSAPAPAGIIGKWRGPIDLLAAESSFTAEQGANRFVFGVPSLEYKIRVAKPVVSEMSLWVGPDGLPVKLESKGQPGGSSSIIARKYSRYNNPDIKIDTPK